MVIIGAVRRCFGRASGPSTRRRKVSGGPGSKIFQGRCAHTSIIFAFSSLGRPSRQGLKETFGTDPAVLKLFKFWSDAAVSAMKQAGSHNCRTSPSPIHFSKCIADAELSTGARAPSPPRAVGQANPAILILGMHGRSSFC